MFLYSRYIKQTNFGEKMKKYTHNHNDEIMDLEEIEGWYEIDKKIFLDNCEDEEEEFQDFDDYLRENFTELEE